MDNGEFTVDFGIQGAKLINFKQMPHKINKRAFILKVQKTQDRSSLFKGRFDFNLYKLIQDNFSNNYTIALEIYFELFPVGSSKQIQRRLYINFQGTYDNDSPPPPFYQYMY